MIFAVSVTQPAYSSVALASTQAMWSIRCKTVQTETCAWVDQEFFHQLLYVNAVNLLLLKIANCNRVEADFRHRTTQPRLQSPIKVTESTFSLRREYRDAERLASVASASQLMMSQATNSINYQIQWQQTLSAKFAYKHASIASLPDLELVCAPRSSISTQKYKPKVGGTNYITVPPGPNSGGDASPLSPPVIYATVHSLNGSKWHTVRETQS